MTILRIVLAVVSISLVVAAASALVLRCKEFVTAIRAERWTPTQGRILESKLLRRARGWLWWPAVSYEYFTGERRHLGHRISAASELPVYASAQERLQRYRPGHEVTVYYDPKHDDRSVLERSGALAVDAYMIGLIAVILMALWMLRLALTGT
jgi:hypothetical protein